MRRKILFLIESLGGGGAEKVLSTIVKHINTQKFEVTVCTITAGGKYDEEVKRRVRLCSLLKSSEDYHGFEKILYWIKYHLIYDWLPQRWVYELFIPKGNDVEIAFVEGFATRLLSYSTNFKSKKIAWVHVDLKQRPWPVQVGIYKDVEDERAIYLRYDSVVCVSQSVEKIMRQEYKLDRTCTIYNPLDEDAICACAQEKSHWDVDKSNYNIISVGRLEHQKGYDMLLPIIRRLKDDGKRVHLWLIGEGSQRYALENLVQELDLLKDVTFTGFLKNPYSLMSKMDLFVCSSRAEGFSLVIAEAMILEVPVISMNCSGPNELLFDYKHCLCDTYEDLYFKIEEQQRCDRLKGTIRKPTMLNLNEVMMKIERLLMTC